MENTDSVNGPAGETSNVFDVVIVAGAVTAAAGGAERQAARLATCLHGDGYRVALVAQGGDGASVGVAPGVHRIDPSEAVPVAAASLSRRLRRRLIGWSGAFGWLKRLRIHMLDSVILRAVLAARRRHAGSRRSQVLEGALVRSARRRLGGKFLRFEEAVRSVRSQTTVSFSSLPNLYTALAFENIPQRLIVSYRNDPNHYRKGEPFDSLVYLVHRRADCITSNAGGTLRDIRAFPEVDPQKVALAPNIGITPRGCVPPVDTHRFVMVGRVVRHKRVDLGIRVFAGVARDLPGWELVVVGDGAELSAAQALAADLGVGDRVRFLGRLEDVPGFLREGGVLLHLSEYEGTPNAVMEAMAMGLPPIVTDGSPGPVELIEGGDRPCGIVCPDGDVESIMGAMVRLGSDDNLRMKLSSAALVRAAGWTWSAVREDWVKILGL